ncbi:thioredoxin-dependent thiol peroxidase [Candidatus Peregrinibacteria bacterium]|jgi:thioredoxin-dependent peroxiredoxin|nr:thioredoxin-dependent thiol peroxidase [Candidatus Peregrinibacteria bacterium]MBT7484634.1 thioredoxin-dependent thiol peroxidase [Candidatus Peregrinibacteria bacterium]
MLKLNQKAPYFTLKNSNEFNIKLSDFIGKWVVLYFYPKDNTPGCTLEALAFTQLKQDFALQNAVILGISKDSCASHQKFTEKQNLGIELLSDPDSEVQKKYGAWRPKKFMGREFMGTVRSTVLINPKGKIIKTWDNVKAKGHAEIVLEELKKS